jgi:hypothetical protein
LFTLAKTDTDSISKKVEQGREVLWETAASRHLGLSGSGIRIAVAIAVGMCVLMGRVGVEDRHAVVIDGDGEPADHWLASEVGVGIVGIIIVVIVGVTWSILGRSSEAG